MLKLVVIQQGQPEREIVVPGDVATVGRKPPCDVVIDEPFVSKRHLRILHGTVAIDLKSRNGTFLDGERLTEAVLLEGRCLSIGQNGVELRVEAPSELLESLDAGDPEGEELRARYALLEAEADRLRGELEAARDTAELDERVARLEGENESLRGRLESLRSDLEEREIDDGGSVQARLAMQRVEAVQELNEKLQLDVDRLQAELEAARAQQPDEPEPEPPAQLAELRAQAELQAARAEQQRLAGELEKERAAARAQGNQAELVRKLRAELAAVRAAARPAPAAGAAPAALEESRREVKQLRAQVAELEGRAAAAGPAQGQKVSDLFFKLQSENVELKRKLASLEGGARSEEPPAGRDARHVRELMEARLRITALEAEVSNLKVAKASSFLAGDAPAAKGGQKAAPSAAKPSPAPGSGGAAPAYRQILEVVVEKDIEGLGRPSGGPAEEFVVIESVRLLRQVERVVTRVAGDLVQLFLLQTMLPDTVGSFRDIVGKLLRQPGDGAERDRLVEYLETLGRWLVAAIGAHRKAAALFAGKLKEDLSEKGLTAKDPLPPYARVPMLAGNELWRRAQEYLSALSPDNIDERIDKIAREQARQLLH